MRHGLINQGIFAQSLGLHKVAPKVRYPSTSRLPDGSVGYHVRAPRRDDCLAAATATCLQIPIARVPDPEIDRRLAAGEDPEAVDRRARRELDAWLDSRGLDMVVLDKAPDPLPARWIGVVPLPGDFTNHCLVMTRSRVLFDPGTAHPEAAVFTAEDVRRALVFRRQSDSKES